MSVSDGQGTEPAPGEHAGETVWRAVRGYLLGEKRGYRDLWAVIVTGLVLLALAAGKHALDEVQIGRRAGTGFTCAIAGAVAQAGREVVEQSSPQKAPTPRAERLLIELGYGPKAQRAKQAHATGRAYTGRITELVERYAHIPAVEARRLVRPNGTVNCDQLKALAKVS